MPQKTVEQRLELIELRQDAFEMAIRALVNQDVDSAEEEGRDDIGNQAQSCIAYDDYHLTQAEREGDINPRRRRIPSASGAVPIVREPGIRLKAEDEVGLCPDGVRSCAAISCNFPLDGRLFFRCDQFRLSVRLRQCGLKGEAKKGFGGRAAVQHRRDR